MLERDGNATVTCNLFAEYSENDRSSCSMLRGQLLSRHLSSTSFMATKKGRSKTASQSTTLFNFFTPGAASSKSSKALSVKKSATAKPETKGKSAVVKPRPLVFPEDIIVIDSDDDTPVVTNKKRRRISTSSGEVEFVEGVVVERKLANKINVKHAQSSRLPNSSEGEQMIASKSLVDAVQPILFGIPSFPAGPMKQSSHSVTPEIISSLQTISFGKPTILPGRGLLELPNDCNTSSVPPPVSLDASIAIDIDLSEEWGTGDEEQALVGEHDDQDCDDLDEMAVEQLDTLALCPVCEKQFPAFVSSRNPTM